MAATSGELSINVISSTRRFYGIRTIAINRKESTTEPPITLSATLLKKNDFADFTSGSSTRRSSVRKEAKVHLFHEVNYSNHKETVQIIIKVNDLAKILLARPSQIAEAYNSHSLTQFIYDNLHQPRRQKKTTQFPLLRGLYERLKRKEPKRILPIPSEQQPLLLNDSNNEFTKIHDYVATHLKECEKPRHINKKEILSAHSFVYLPETKVAISLIKTFIGEGGFSRITHAVDAEGKIYAFRTLRRSNLGQFELIANLLLSNDPQFVTGPAVEYKGHWRKRESESFPVKTSPQKYVDKVGFILPFKSGGDLIQYIVNYEKQHVITETKMCEYYLKMAKIIESLHNTYRLVHFDLKPDNFLVDNDENFSLCDFGFCAPFEEIIKPRGTLGYIDPTIIHYDEDGIAFDIRANPACDMWSLGILFATLWYDIPSDLLLFHPQAHLRDELLTFLTTLTNKQLEVMKRTFLIKREVEGTLDWIVDHLLQLDPRKRLTAEECVVCLESLIATKSEVQGSKH